MELIEWIGSITGIIAVILLSYNHIINWPIGFINILCFIWVCWHNKLYGDVIVNMMFLISGIYGLWHWKTQTLTTPNKVLKKHWGIYLFLTFIVYIITLYYFKIFTDCSYPILEAWILCLSFIGQYLTIKRKIESWYYWIIADALMVYVYALKDLFAFTLYAAILFVLAFVGLFKWYKLFNQSKLSSKDFIL